MLTGGCLVSQFTQSKPKQTTPMIKNKYNALKAALLVAVLTLTQSNICAAAAADAAIGEQIDGVKLTALAAAATITLVITAGIGLRLYGRLGKRAASSL